MAKGIRYTDEFKQEAVKVRRKCFKNREEAKAEIFNYIEMFYNPKRRHTHNGRKSPNETDKLYFEKLKSV